MVQQDCPMTRDPPQGPRDRATEFHNWCWFNRTAARQPVEKPLIDVDWGLTAVDWLRFAGDRPLVGYRRFW